MTKNIWLSHIEDVTGQWPPSKGGDKEAWRKALSYHNTMEPDCAICKARLRTRKQSENRRAHEDAYRSCGLVKVKGAVSGATYWE